MSCLPECLDVMLLPQSYHYQNLSEGSDSVGGQLREDKESLFINVTNFGRVWRKVPDRDAGSLAPNLAFRQPFSKPCHNSLHH